MNRAYQNYIDIGDPSWTIQFSESNFTDPNFKRKALNALNILVEYGYAEFTARAIGFSGCRLAEVALNLQKTALENLIIPRLYKDQTAFMSMVMATKFLGITTNFFGHLSSGLPDDYKQLMEAFVYEMKNPHLTKETRLKKITDFLTEISSGALSGIASSALTTLLFLCFDRYKITFISQLSRLSSRVLADVFIGIAWPSS
ncbi:MAG: hypothetical protein V8Q30_02625 [Acutalibacteraceae bacterium]